MNIVGLLTTWNRPKLLEQALRHIERECADVGAPLVIADDQSNNQQTLKLLEEAEARGAKIIRRPYHREPDQNPHPLVGLNNQYAFMYIVKNIFPDLILKVDDDTVFVEGAFKRMLKAREEALLDGHKVIATSGIKGIYESLVYAPSDRSYRIVSTPCAAACLYEIEDIRICFTEIPSSQIAHNGFDWTIWNEYRHKWKGDHIAVATAPGSVCAHAAFSGVHVSNTEINVDYEGSLEGLVRNE